jgi:trimeric autotransporter adhesin
LIILTLGFTSMNKIFCSVWNEALGAWVAASELARHGAGRGSSALRLTQPERIVRSATHAHWKRQPIALAVASCISLMMALPIYAQPAPVPSIALTNNATWGFAGAAVDGTVIFNTTGPSATNGLNTGLMVWKGGAAGRWVKADSMYFNVNSTLADSQATGTNSIAVGPRSQATSADSIAVGNGANAAGSYAIAIGADSKSTGSGGVGGLAIGGGNTTLNGFSGTDRSNIAARGSIAIGFGSQAIPTGALAAPGAASQGGTAVGVYANANGGSYNTATGYQSQARGTGVGTAINVDNAAGSSSYGAFSQARANGATALGVSSNASAENAVALGAGSIASRAGNDGNAIPVFVPGLASLADTSAINATNSSKLGAVSVGSGAAGGNRQIINVAAGSLDSDAVNVSQLKATTALASLGWDISANGGAASNIAPGEKINVIDGSNTTVSFDGATNSLKVDVSATPTFTSVTSNALTVNNNASIGGTLSVTGASSLSGGATIGNNLTISAGTAINLGGNVVNNVAPGALSAASTQAVNGSQLFATNNAIAAVATTAANAGKGWNISANGGAASTVAPGDSVNFVSGSNANVSYDNATKNLTIGVVAAPVFTSVTANTVAVNNTLSVSGASSLSGGASIGNNLTLSAGTAVNMGGNVVSNVGAGAISSSSTDAINGSQLFATNQAIASAVAGNKGWNLSANGGAPALVAPGDTLNVINGSNTTVNYNATTKSLQVDIVANPSFGNTTVNSLNVMQNATLAGSLAVTGPVSVAGATTLSGGATINTNLTITPGASIDMGGNVISNAAPGVAPTDVATVSQLSGMNSQSKQYTDGQINQLRSEIAANQKDMRAGVAGAMAMATMPQASTPGKNMLSAGVATFQGQTSVALGLSRLLQDGKWVLRVNATADTRGSVGVAAGAGFQW